MLPRGALVPTGHPSLASPFVVGLLAMHHIYSDAKKQEIETRALQNDLSGRYLYGKPGMVVFEGAPRAVANFERRIRGLRWQACVPMGRLVRLFRAPILPRWKLDELPHITGSSLNVVDEQEADRLGLTSLPSDGAYFPIWCGSVQQHTPARVWSTFDAVGSVKEMEAELASHGLSKAWALLNVGFSARRPTPPHPRVLSVWPANEKEED